MKSTFLKVMAVICLVFGIIGALVSVFGVIGAGYLSGATVSAIQEAGIEVGAEVADIAGAVAAAAIAVAVVMVIESVVMILAGVFGISASSNVQKVGRAIVMGVIMLVIAIISMIFSLSSGSFSWIGVVDLIFALLYFLAAFMFKKKAQAQ